MAEHEAATALIRLAALVQDVHGRVSESQDLPPVQAKMLCILIGGPKRMTELAGMLGIEKAAVTGLADRAQLRGLVERTAVQGDRRALALGLTAAGRRAATEFHAEATAELNALLGALPRAELGPFREACAAIVRGAEPAARSA